MVIRWRVGKGKRLVRVKKGGVVGWKVAARSYAAKALGGKKRVDRMVAVSREMEHSKALATTLSAEIQSGGSNLKSGAHEMHGFCWNPV